MTAHAVQFITSPTGEEMAVLPRADYEALVSAAALQDQASEEADAAAVRAFLAKRPAALPLAVWDAIDAGVSPLRAIRDYRGFSQEALAAKTGLGQSVISRLESGARTAKLPDLRRLAQALNVTVQDLTPETD